MISITVDELCKMIKGAAAKTQIRSVSVAGVSTDTRTIKEGTLFVPLIGTHYDGHDYLEEAFRSGAAAALWQRDRGAAPEESAIIEVDDTLLALQEMAAAYRRQLGVKVIGITGSNGKTSTKDLVASVLATRFRVHKTQGNLNNHIGLPITLLGMDLQTEIAVLEMGMSGRGEIDLLSKIAGPDAVIITNIGEAHMLQLGSREEIARAKFEIVSGLCDHGLLIYNGDEPLLRILANQFEQARRIECVRFGRQPSHNDYYPGEITVASDKTAFSARRNNTDHEIAGLSIPLLGRHNVINALAAVAVADNWGLDESEIRIGLQTAEPTGMRIEAVKGITGLTILNDAYNASPSSMKAAICVIKELAGFRNKIVVLGDMLELGPDTESFHREIGTLLFPGEINYVFTYGGLAAYIAEECTGLYPVGAVEAFNDKTRLIRRIAAVVSPEDVVLVKASRGKRLEEVVDALQMLPV